MAAEEEVPLVSPGNLKALVWQQLGFKKNHDSEEPDKNNAICKICEVEVKYNGNTTNLRSHLARHHPEFAQQAGKMKPLALQQTRLAAAFGSKFPSTSVRAEEITSALASFICKDLSFYLGPYVWCPWIFQ